MRGLLCTLSYKYTWVQGITEFVPGHIAKVAELGSGAIALTQKPPDLYYISQI